MEKVPGKAPSKDGERKTAPRNERIDSGVRAPMNAGNRRSPIANVARGSGTDSYGDDGGYGSSKRSSDRASSDHFSESDYRAEYKELERKERGSRSWYEWGSHSWCQQRIQQLEDELHQTRALLNLHSQEMRRMETQNVEMQRRLEEKASELKGARAFLKHANKLSGADVISLVNDLNSEVFQGAASIVDTLEFEGAGRRMDDAEWEWAMGATSKTIGTVLTQALIARRGKDDHDPILVRYALQTCLISCCFKMCISWAPEEENSQFLRSVYSEIQKEEDQVVAGRWRALTRAHIWKTRNQEAEIEQIIRKLRAVLIVAGCSNTELSAELEKDLSEVTTLAIRVQTAIGESITSMDLEPYIPELRIPFDATLMENEDRSQAQGKNTVGFTGLGLTQLVNGDRMLALVKAKVLLD